MLNNPDTIVANKIALAKHLYLTIAPLLSGDTKLPVLLQELAQGIEASRQVMVSTGLAEECADCAVNGVGTCCGVMYESRHDEFVLLINLLLGVTFPERRFAPGLCYFVSERGCILKAREVICINYLCRRVFEAIPFKSIVYLQQTTGNEINTLFFLKEYLKTIIRLPVS
jgi:hypothetical protein